MTLNILILEDVPEDAELVAYELKRAGFSFTWTRVDDEFGFVSRVDQADVIIADYTLPKYSALRALDVVSQKGLDTPFIVVSGTIGEETAVDCMKRGATDYLLKDRLGRLSQAIERALLERDTARQKKQAERNLRLSEERFRTLIENTPIGIAVIRGNDYIYINQEFLRLTESPSRSDVQQLRDFVSRLQQDSKYEATLITHTGRELPVYVSSSSIELPNGRAQVYSFIDLTDQKQLDNAKIRIEAMKISIQKERELAELKERFASTVSHEYRTPLTIISTSATLLEKYYGRLKDEDRVRYLSEIKNQVHYMSMLLNDILVLSSTEASNLRLEITPIYLLQFCCDTVEQAAIVDDWKHSFEMLYGGDLNEVIRLDERLLKHVILNLVLNAAKYSPVGTLVTLVIEITKDDVLFQIEDCGIGIPAKDQEKVFESFYRGSNVGTISGTGLGLAITKRSVEAQGGEISFESEEGIGTIFRVRFPLVK